MRDNPSNYLNEQSWYLTSKIKKQLPLNSATDTLLEFSDKTQKLMTVMLFLAIILNLVVQGSGSMKYMIAMLNSMQITIHLPLMSISMPSNVSFFFQLILPFVMFDIISSQYSTEIVFQFDYEKQQELEQIIPDQTRELGYGSHNSLLNLGSLFIFLIFLLAKALFLYLVKIKAWISGKKLDMWYFI